MKSDNQIEQSVGPIERMMDAAEDNGVEYRCYDGFTNAEAAENFLRQATDRFGVIGLVVHSEEERVRREGLGKYPHVLINQGFCPGGSGNFIVELADLAEKTYGATYQYS